MKNIFLYLHRPVCTFKSLISYRPAASRRANANKEIDCVFFQILIILPLPSFISHFAVYKNTTTCFIISGSVLLITITNLSL